MLNRIACLLGAHLRVTWTNQLLELYNDRTGKVVCTLPGQQGTCQNCNVTRYRV